MVSVIVHSIFISNYKFNTGSYLPHLYMYTLANYLTHAYLCRSMGKGATMTASDLKEMPVGCLHLESHPFATGWSGNVVWHV